MTDAGSAGDAELRRDQLTAAPKASPDDAEPRIDVSETAEGHVRVEVREDAAVRPGGDPGLVG